MQIHARFQLHSYSRSCNHGSIRRVSTCQHTLQLIMIKLIARHHKRDTMSHPLFPGFSSVVGGYRFTMCTWLKFEEVSAIPYNVTMHLVVQICITVQQHVPVRASRLTKTKAEWAIAFHFLWACSRNRFSRISAIAASSSSATPDNRISKRSKPLQPTADHFKAFCTHHA